LPFVFAVWVAQRRAPVHEALSAHASLIASRDWGLAHLGQLSAQAALATGYIAQVTCSCRFVSGRDMASCDTDREPGTDVVQVEEDSANRTITAKVPLLSTRISRFDPEYGCMLDAP
jgi:hypothetical protein